LSMCLLQREKQLDLQAEQLASLKRAELVQEDLLVERASALQTLRGELDAERQEAARLREALASARQESAVRQRVLDQLRRQEASTSATYSVQVLALETALESAVL